MRVSLFVFFCLFASCVQAASRQQDTQTQNALQDLRYEVAAQEQELASYRERMVRLEETIAYLHEELGTYSQKNARSVDAKVSPFEAQLNDLRGAQQALIEDVRRLNENVSSSAAGWKQCRSQLHELEKILTKQTGNVNHLQQALSSLMGALQKEDPALALSPGHYRVQSGDSLGEIAIRHQTTVQKLRELNALTGDRILVGQELKLP